MSINQGHRAKKRFGQNFLQDQSVIARIVQNVAPKKEDKIVEIGPGQGALTIEIMRSSGAITAIELDRDLLEPLQKTCAPFGTLELHNVDALKFDFSTLFDGERKLRLVGNLPYNISTPILFHLLQHKEIIQDMHFMLQKEVVDRMAAVPGNKSYGRLSIMLQLYCEVTSLFDIGPEAFDPRPKVDSSIVRLVPREKVAVEIPDHETFAHLVTKSFAQRRKTLRNNLKGLINDNGFKAANIDPSRRAETLSLEEFGQLSQYLDITSS